MVKERLERDGGYTVERHRAMVQNELCDRKYEDEIIKEFYKIRIGMYLKRRKYPFFRELSAVTHGEISQDLKQMLREAQTGPAFREVAKKYELLPLNAPHP